MNVEKICLNAVVHPALWVSHETINRTDERVSRKRRLWVLCKSEAIA